MHFHHEIRVIRIVRSPTGDIGPLSNGNRRLRNDDAALVRLFDADDLPQEIFEGSIRMEAEMSRRR